MRCLIVEPTGREAYSACCRICPVVFQQVGARMIESLMPQNLDFTLEGLRIEKVTRFPNRSPPHPACSRSLKAAAPAEQGAAPDLHNSMMKVLA